MSCETDSSISNGDQESFWHNDGCSGPKVVERFWVEQGGPCGYDGPTLDQVRADFGQSAAEGAKRSPLSPGLARILVNGVDYLHLSLGTSKELRTGLRARLAGIRFLKKRAANFVEVWKHFGSVLKKKQETPVIHPLFLHH